MPIFENTRNGLVISDIIDGQRVKQTYQGYTKREATAKFKRYIKALKSGEKRYRQYAEAC